MADKLPRLNGFISRIVDNDIPFGYFLNNGDYQGARLVGDSDLDFVVVDMEHHGFDFIALGTTMQWLISRRQMQAAGVVAARPTPFVRLPANASERNGWLIKQALDYGAFGVIIPRAQNAADVEHAVKSARYSRGPSGGDPQGHRGVISSSPALRYWGMSTFPAYFDKADLWPVDPEGEVVVMPIIEDELGFMNIDQIVAVPGVGAVFYGPIDGAVALGSLGRRVTDAELPELQQARVRVVDACNRANIPVGTFGPDIAQMETLIGQGFDFIFATTPARRELTTKRSPRHV